MLDLNYWIEMPKNINYASNSIAPVGIIFQQADGQIQGCNQDAEKILGYRAETIIATLYEELPWQTIHEDGSAFPVGTHPALATLKTGQPTSNVTMGFYKPDGDLVWLLLDSQPLFQGNGELLGVVTSFKDLTSQKNQELAHEAFGIIADRIPGVLYLYDVTTGGNIYLNSQTYSLLGYGREEILAMGENFIASVMHPEDLERFSSHLEKLSQAQDDEVCKFEYRMRHKNSQWRWFCSQERVFNRDRDGSVKQIIGIASDISEQQAALRERKETELNLIESEKRLNLATVASGIGMWFWDLAVDKLEWTDQCNNLFGLDADAEISYERFLSILHPEDSERTNNLVQQALTSKAEYDTEYRVVWHDGSLHWLAAKGKVFYEGDRPVGMMGMVQDISQRKQTEAQLVQTNSVLNSIISDTTDVIFVKDLQGQYIVANQATADFLGITIEEILNRDDTELFEPEIARSIVEVDRRVMNEGIFLSYEEKMLQNGIRRSLYTNKYPWRNEAGNILGVIGICRDITELRKSQQKLQENEHLLSLALSSAKAGSWDWEVATGKILWSPENYELHGIDPQIQPLQYRHWKSSLHPEDFPQINREVQQVLAGETSEFRAEFRIIHPQKGTRWLLNIGNLTRNTNGEPVRLSGINLDITEQKEIEEKLRNSEQQLRRVIDSLHSFVGVLTPDGVMLEVNRTALEAANLSAEDVVNKPFDQTYWWSHSTQIQTQLRAAITAAASGESVQYDVTVRVGADKYILIDFSIVPLFDNKGKVKYLIPSGIDITDREASKQALQRSQHELKLITEVIPQQIWTALPNGTIDYINQRWQDYSGVNLQQIQKHGWELIIHPEDLSAIDDIWRTCIATGNNCDTKVRLRSQKGEYHWFLCKARPLRNEEGIIIKWYGTNTSITRIVELEEQLRKQTEDLQQANRLKDEFLAIVSHELRTPLNPILGWSQLIAKGSLDSQKTATAIEVIQRNAQLQVQLIDDLLDVSRILRGKLKLELIPLNLETVIKSAIATVQLTAEAKSIEIATEFEPNIGQVAGDANRVAQIIWNILSNAIKFTPECGLVTVKLQYIEPEIQSHLLSQEVQSEIAGEPVSDRYIAYAQIEIKDTGVGIEPEFLPYVFERFRQAESGNTRKYGGLGLGLAIVRYLTELHHGTVTVESAGRDRGATFRVKLPLINHSSTKNLLPQSMKESTISARLTGTQILVIDDEGDSRELLTLIFQQEGANAIAASSANEALEVLQKITPDLIISDIGMPRIDGYTLMNQIRSLPQGKQISAIAITAYAGEIDRQRSLEAGFQHHLAKPIDINKLLNITSELLSERHQS